MVLTFHEVPVGGHWFCGHMAGKLWLILLAAWWPECRNHKNDRQDWQRGWLALVKNDTIYYQSMSCTENYQDNGGRIAARGALYGHCSCVFKLSHKNTINILHSNWLRFDLPYFITYPFNVWGLLQFCSYGSVAMEPGMLCYQHCSVKLETLALLAELKLIKTSFLVPKIYRFSPPSRNSFEWSPLSAWIDLSGVLLFVVQFVCIATLYTRGWSTTFIT